MGGSSVCLSVWLSVCLSVCWFVCHAILRFRVFAITIPFNTIQRARIKNPTRHRTSNSIFRFFLHINTLIGGFPSVCIYVCLYVTLFRIFAISTVYQYSNWRFSVCLSVCLSRFFAFSGIRDYNTIQHHTTCSHQESHSH